MGAVLSIGGSAIFGPIGGAVGSLLGQVIGGFIGGPVQKGPKLADRKVMSSINGASIPQIYGTARIAGNMIWSSGINEDAHTNTSFFGGKIGGQNDGAPATPGGGKGGMVSFGQKTVLYTYHADFAISFGRGVATDVLRIWADGKIIYDKTGRSKHVKKKGMHFTFYPGDEEQLPDPWMVRQDDLLLTETGLTPAYRGQCYIMFRRFQLADYGNRIPSISAEISFNTDVQQTFQVADLFTEEEGGISGPLSIGVAQGAFDLPRERAFVVVGDVTPNVLRRINLGAMVEDAQFEVAGTVALSGLDAQIWAMGDGSLLGNTTLSNARPVVRIDPDTGQITGQFGVASGTLSDTTAHLTKIINAAPINMAGPDGSLYFAMAITELNGLAILAWAATPTFISLLPDADAKMCCTGRNFPGYGEGWWVDSARGVHRIRIAANATGDAGSNTTQGVTQDAIATCAVGGTPVGIIYVESDDSVLVLFSGGGNSVVKVMSDGTFPWATPSNLDGGISFGAIPSAGGTANFSSSVVSDSEFYWVVGQHIYGIDAITGTQLLDGANWSGTGLPSAGTSASQAYDGITQSIVCTTQPPNSNIERIFVGRATGAPIVLGDIVVDLCSQVGLEDTDLDVTELTDEVDGYIVSQSSTVRNCLDQLRQGYFFDGVESDYMLKFVKYGGSSVMAITQQDLAELDGETGEVFRETRQMEVELPARYTVKYIDKQNNYDPNAQSAPRIKSPVRTMYSNNRISADLPIVLSGFDAKQIAYKTQFAAFLERSRYAFKLPWRYGTLDPADVVTVTLDDGSSYQTRIVKDDRGADGVLDLESVLTDAPTFVSNVSGGGQTIPDQLIPYSGPSRIFLPDCPLLRDVDDLGGAASRVYIMAGGYGSEAWTGAQIWESSDGATYAYVATNPFQIAYGIAMNVLDDVDDPFLTDEASSLRIRMIAGSTLESITQLQMLNGANAAILGSEVIQFRDVTEEDDGSFTLTGLLRGRRGTDLNTGAHVTGETFLFLIADTVSEIQIPLSEIGGTRFFKPVTYGAFLDETIATSKIHHGNDLKPYAVVHQAGEYSGSDIDLTWQRRTRFAGAWIDGIGTVPLNEATEAYEIDIYDDPGSSVLRTLTSTSPAVTYTAANIAVDFGTGSPPTELNVAIYQMSAVIGRGFGRIVRLTIEA